MTLYGLAILALIALLPASIARRKGRSFLGWYIGSVLLWIVAFPLSIMVGDIHRRCPECAEPIQWEARRCPHCQSVVAAAVCYDAPEGRLRRWGRTVCVLALAFIASVAIAKALT